MNLHDTMDAREWAAEWLKTLKEHPDIATDEGTMIGWFANAIMAGHDAANRDRSVLPSEALYAFAGWLSTRDEMTIFSRSHECGRCAELVGRFCETNELEPPREDWGTRGLKHPIG